MSVSAIEVGKFFARILDLDEDDEGEDSDSSEMFTPLSKEKPWLELTTDLDKNKNTFACFKFVSDDSVEARLAGGELMELEFVKYTCTNVYNKKEKEITCLQAKGKSVLGEEFEFVLRPLRRSFYFGLIAPAFGVTMKKKNNATKGESESESEKKSNKSQKPDFVVVSQGPFASKITIPLPFVDSKTKQHMLKAEVPLSKREYVRVWCDFLENVKAPVKSVSFELDLFDNNQEVSLKFEFVDDVDLTSRQLLIKEYIQSKRDKALEMEKLHKRVDLAVLGVYVDGRTEWRIVDSQTAAEEALKKFEEEARAELPHFITIPDYDLQFSRVDF